MTFSPKHGEEKRWERIVELLVRLDSFTDLRAMVLLGLTDDAEPNPFAVLAERGLPLAYAAGRSSFSATPSAGSG